jgi:dolichol-phosphate mannosyltransferase
LLKLVTAAVETPHEVLIIYDYPEDNSVLAAQSIQDKYPNLRLVYNDLGRGVLNALRKGVEAARGQYILIAFVDEVASLLVIDDMVALINEGCDFVSGTRYSHGGRRFGGSTIGTFLSTAANLLFQLSGFALTDATTGFKMFKRSCFDELNLGTRPVGWVVAFEMSIKAQLAGFKLGEVPVVSIDRLYGGQSTFRLWSWLVEYSKCFIWGAKQLALRKTGKPEVRVRVPKITPCRPRP